MERPADRAHVRQGARAARAASPHFGVLTLIASDPGSTQQELADRLADRSQLDGGGDRRARGARPTRSAGPPRRPAKACRPPDRKRASETLERARSGRHRDGEGASSRPLDADEVATLHAAAAKARGRREARELSRCGDLARVGDRPQRRARSPVAQVFDERRQGELLAQAARAARRSRSRGPQRRDLEQDPAGLAEVDRVEVEAVDHRRRPACRPRAPARATPRARRPGTPRRRGAPCPRPGSRARRAARRRRTWSRGAVAPRPPNAPVARGREPERLARGAPGSASGRRRTRRHRRSPGGRARRGSRGARRSAARRRRRHRELVLEALGVGEPQPSAVDAAASTPCSPRRPAQKSSASAEPTRQTILWTIPSPARPGAAPGYSKKVMSEPGSPSRRRRTGGRRSGCPG